MFKKDRSQAFLVTVHRGIRSVIQKVHTPTGQVVADIGTASWCYAEGWRGRIQTGISNRSSSE